MNIAAVLNQQGISAYGVLDFADAGSLLECRKKAQLPPKAASVIVCLLPYRTGEFPNRNVARYAVVPDYHKIAKEIFEPLCLRLRQEYPTEEFVWFADNSPLQETILAAKAGLGVLGENGLLIHETYGSYVFVGEIVTTLPLPSTMREIERCCRCGICIRSCPTQALTENGFQKELCRSFLTQKKGELTPWQAEQVKAGGMVCGCDICSDVCPMNQNKKLSDIPAFYADNMERITEENLDEILTSRTFGYRGKGVILRNLNIIHTQPSKCDGTNK